MTDANHVSAGFVYQLATGALELIRYPGAVNTGALGVDNRGILTGYWLDADNGEHGFARIDGEFHLNDAEMAVCSYSPRGAAIIMRPFPLTPS